MGASHETSLVILLIALQLSGCALFGGDRKTFVFPEEATIAVGARHDLVVGACNQELELTDVAGVLIAAGIVSAFGRIDVLAAVPEALIPGCEAIPFTVAETTWVGDTPFELTRSEASPNVFTVEALREGDGLLRVTLQTEDGERHVVEATYSARRVTRVDASVGCGDTTTTETPRYIASETTLSVGMRVFAGDTELSRFGYGYIPLVAEGAVLEAVDEDPSRITLTTPAAPATVRLSSPDDPSFERVYDVYDETSFDGFVVERTGDASFVIGVGAAVAFRGVATIGGERACGDTLPRVFTTLTPDVCAFGASETRSHAGDGGLSIDALAPGICEVRGELEGTALGDTLVFEVAPGWDVLDDEPALVGLSPWGLAATGPDEVYVCGEATIDGARVGAVARFDGVTWSRLDPAVPTVLVAAWAAGPNDAFFAGGGGTILRFDGATFTPMSTGVEVDLRAIWGGAPDDVYAVGSDETILHFDGSEWSTVELPAGIGLGGRSFFVDVWGSAPNDVYAISPDVALRYDGVEWSDVTPPRNPGNPNVFSAVWASAPSDVLLAQFLVWRWDGVEWSTDPGDRGLVRASAIHGLSATDVASAHTTLFYFDGAQWTDHGAPIDAELTDVVMVAPGQVYVSAPDQPVSRLVRP